MQTILTNTKKSFFNPKHSIVTFSLILVSLYVENYLERHDPVGVDMVPISSILKESEELNYFFIFCMKLFVSIPRNDKPQSNSLTGPRITFWF